MVLKNKPEKGKAMEYSRTTICGGETTGEQKIVIRTHSYPKTIQVVPSESNRGKFHPTQKPIALFGYLIKTYTNENDIVLDNCIGSGTTAVACKKLKRNFIGFESEQKYVAIANKRLEEL